jgi:hypothetical protein
MGRDMLGLVAPDFILRIVLARVMCIAFEKEVLGMRLDDGAADTARLGIPSDVVADFESCAHDLSAPVGHGDGLAYHLIRVTPLVVVPTHDLEQIAVDDFCQLQIDNRGARIADDIGGDERIAGHA